MNLAFTSRSLMVWALLAGTLVGFSGIAGGQRLSYKGSCARIEGASYQVHGRQQAPAPIERRAPAAQNPSVRQAVPNRAGPNPAGSNQAGRLAGPGRGGLNRPKGEHLAEWMNQHGNLTLEQQQQALGHEPGFQELPAATQQRMRQRLSQLNAMSPNQRQRVLDRNEAMERLDPDQRAQVRGAMQGLGSLPPEQRKQVAQSFRELRQLPPNQRMGAMLDPRYGWMNPTERSALLHLIQVEPMLPSQ